MISDVKGADSRWKRLYKVSGAIALLLGALFLGGFVNVWLQVFPDNWLMKLFELNAGFNAVNFEMMRGLNPLDIVILALVAAMHLGLYAALMRTSKIWSTIAVIQPFLAIVLFIVTEIIGRSAVMGAGLVMSGVMLKSNIFGKTTAFAGILASVLLLVGDFSTTATYHSGIIAAIIGTGYLLLVTWFLLVGQRLLRLGNGLRSF